MDDTETLFAAPSEIFDPVQKAGLWTVTYLLKFIGDDEVSALLDDLTRLTEAQWRAWVEAGRPRKERNDSRYVQRGATDGTPCGLESLDNAQRWALTALGWHRDGDAAFATAHAILAGVELGKGLDPAQFAAHCKKLTKKSAAGREAGTKKRKDAQPRITETRSKAQQLFANGTPKRSLVSETAHALGRPPSTVRDHLRGWAAEK